MLDDKRRLRSMDRFKIDQSGQIGVWFAIMAFPLLLASSFVLDYTRSEQIKSELTSALDEAAIAAVLNQSLTVPERAVFAETYF